MLIGVVGPGGGRYVQLEDPHYKTNFTHFVRSPACVGKSAFVGMFGHRSAVRQPEGDPGISFSPVFPLEMEHFETKVSRHIFCQLAEFPGNLDAFSEEASVASTWLRRCDFVILVLKDLDFIREGDSPIESWYERFCALVPSTSLLIFVNQFSRDSEEQSKIEGAVQCWQNEKKLPYKPPIFDMLTGQNEASALLGRNISTRFPALFSEGWSGHLKEDAIGLNLTVSAMEDIALHGNVKHLGRFLSGFLKKLPVIPQELEMAGLIASLTACQKISAEKFLSYGEQSKDAKRRFLFFGVLVHFVKKFNKTMQASHHNSDSSAPAYLLWQEYFDAFCEQERELTVRSGFQWHFEPTSDSGKLKLRLKTVHDWLNDDQIDQHLAAQKAAEAVVMPRTRSFRALVGKFLMKEGAETLESVLEEAKKTAEAAAAAVESEPASSVPPTRPSSAASIASSLADGEADAVSSPDLARKRDLVELKAEAERILLEQGVDSRAYLARVEELVRLSQGKKQTEALAVEVPKDGAPASGESLFHLSRHA